MSTTKNFAAHDDIVILTLGGTDYIKAVNNAVAPYALFPGGNGVTPGKELWEAEQATSCEVDETKFIRDNANYQYASIVGPRPRNIVRR
jgi:hypothetical protein